jgi:hypothetical protein
LSDLGLPAEFTSQTPEVCVVDGATGMLLDAGKCTIVADPPGNDEFAPAPPVVNIRGHHQRPHSAL